MTITAVPADRRITTTQDYPGLYAWQQEALQAWRDNARTGVVEAVTGAGKTMVGIAAAFEAVRQGIKVLVLVPTSELQTQWRSSLRKSLPGARLGLLGDGQSDTLERCDILIAVVHSAATRRTLLSHKDGLVIADECHRYAAPMFSEALQAGYAWRLGLSATYERGDGGHMDRLEPFFGKLVYRIWYDRAMADGVIAPFDIALIGVDLVPAERTRYDQLSEVMLKSARNLETYAGIQRDPYPAFIAAVAALSQKSGTVESGVARKYMAAMTARRALLAETPTKSMALAALRTPLAASGKALVFTQTKKSADSAAAMANALGLPAATVMSGMDRLERRAALTAFKDGRVKVLAAPQVLDEGVDVPAADLAVVVSSSRTERQMIQRLGRVIRCKDGNAPGRLAVLYATGTVEDPALQGPDYLINVLPSARNVGRFAIATQLAEIEVFLALPAEGEEAPEHEPDVEPAPAQEPEPVAAPAEPAPFDLEPTEWEEDWDEAGTLGSSFDLYLEQAAGHALLTAEDEVGLAEDIEAGLYAEHLLADGTERPRQLTHELREVAAAGRAAQERFMMSNLRFVIHMAKSHIGRGMDIDDLVSEGNFGLWRAIQKYDHSQGFRFTTYASHWIRQSMTRAIADQSRTIRLPVYQHDFVNKVLATSTRMELDPSSVKGSVAIADEVRSEPGKVRFAVRSALSVRSLDFDVSDGRGWVEPLGWQLSDPDEPGVDAQVLADDGRAEARDLMGIPLDNRTANILAMRYGFTNGEEHTLDEIGAHYGVTRERIRQLEKLGLAEIRERLGVPVPAKKLDA